MENMPYNIVLFRFSGRYIPFRIGLSFMQEVRLTLKKRAFPSQGRVRFNLAHLPDLGIQQGDHVDLINEATKKSVTTSVIADDMVRQGQVRVSEEDLKILGLQDDDEVLVRKTPPLQEKIKKAAADANASLSKGAGRLDTAVRKTAGEVKTEAAKTAVSVKKETKNASDRIGKAAAKTAGAVKKSVKKTVKKATGSGDDL
jgi:formylmethanofuran dehydrogenase subunit D